MANFTGPSAKNEIDLTGCTCVPCCLFLSSLVLQAYSGSYGSADTWAIYRVLSARLTCHRDGLSLDLLYEVSLTVQVLLHTTVK